MFAGFRDVELDVEHESGRMRVHAVVGGDGPPVLLLHGFPQSHLMWHAVAPELAADHTVVAADLRGYGESGIPSGDLTAYSFRAMADDQVAVMAQLGTTGSPSSDTTAAGGSRTGWRWITRTSCMGPPCSTSCRPRTCTGRWTSGWPPRTTTGSSTCSRSRCRSG